MVKLRMLDHDDDFAPRRVLLTRLSAIGDCLLTLPLAVKIKQLWPDCQLTWVVDCRAASLVERHSAVDEVWRIEKRWMLQPRRWQALRSELREKQFDVVFDPQGLTKSSLLGWLSGAPQRIGFDYSHGRELAPLVATQRIRKTARHMVDVYLQLLQPWCVLPAGAGEFHMPVYAEEAARVEQWLQQLGLRAQVNSTGGSPSVSANGGASTANLSIGIPSTGNFSPGTLSPGNTGLESAGQICQPLTHLASSSPQRWVALNVGAAWASKQWPPERFGWIAQELWQRHGLRSVVLWAGDSERALAEQVVAQAAGAALPAAETSLCELVEVIRRAELLISGDTSPLHIASAVQTPCVGLFGPTWSDESGPYGNKHIAIQSTVLPDPRQGQRRSSNSSMNAIEISEVLQACNKLLAQLGMQAPSAAPRMAA